MRISSILQTKITKKILITLFWIGVWHLVSLMVDKVYLLASPWIVLKTLFLLITELLFWKTILYSFCRIVAGFLLAVTIGSLFAVLSARFKTLNELLSPLIQLIKSTPIASFIILVLLWASSDKLSTIISLLIVFPVIYTNVLAGIEETDPKLLEMAAVFKLPARKRLTAIYLHDVMPFFLSACTVSLGLCWKSGVAAEVIGLPTGSIGERLYQAKIFLNSGELLAWTLVIIMISFLFEKTFLWMLKLLYKRIENAHSQ